MGDLEALGDRPGADGALSVIAGHQQRTLHPLEQQHKSLLFGVNRVDEAVKKG